MKLSVDFSAETLQVRREWNDTFKVLKEKICQTRLLYPANSPPEMKQKSLSQTNKI